MISKKNEKEIEIMRDGREVMRTIFQEIYQAIKVGANTFAVDHKVEHLCQQFNVKPAFKGYQNFPFCICASPNDVVVHGFPNKTPLKEGDVVSIDFGIIKEQLYLDSAYTFSVGVVSDEVAEILKVTKVACKAGVTASKVGNTIRDISRAVENTIKPHGYGIVREYVGHGIGYQLHEEPQIPNFDNGSNGAILEVGMALAIEPMVNIGTEEVYVAEDKWAVKTRDHKVSAHFEHTVVVAEEGPEIMTAWPDEAEGVQ